MITYRDEKGSKLTSAEMDASFRYIQGIIEAVVVSANITAEIDKKYHVVSNATFTDPASPVEGKGYEVFVRNGIATIGGVDYPVGSYVFRTYHSGAWASQLIGGTNDSFLVDLTKYSWYHWKPYSTGWFGSFLPNVVGTADNISNVFTGNDLVRATRRRYKSATTTAGSSVEFYDSIRQTQIGDGFIFTLKFGNEDASTVANARFFAGLYSSLSAIGNVNPSTLQNVLGIGADSGDTHLQLIHNDATGTATKIDLGVNFPANNLAEDVYLLQILNVRNSSDVFVRVTRVNTDTVYETTLTTDLPVSTSGGYVTPHLWRNNGTTALEVKLSCIDMNLYKLL